MNTVHAIATDDHTRSGQVLDAWRGVGQQHLPTADRQTA